MKASNVMAFAIIAGIVGRWAHGKKAIPDAKGVIEVVFAVIVISLMDQGEAAPVAKGFAWLFAAAVMLGNDSPLTGLAGASSAPAVPAGPKLPPTPPGAPGPFPIRH